MLRLVRNLIVILAVVLGLAFGFFNYSPTRVDLLWGTTEAPLAVMLGLAFLLGLIIALIFCGLRIARLRGRLSSAGRRLKKAEAENAKLRNDSVSDA